MTLRHGTPALLLMVSLVWTGCAADGQSATADKTLGGAATDREQFVSFIEHELEGSCEGRAYAQCPEPYCDWEAGKDACRDVTPLVPGEVERTTLVGSDTHPYALIGYFGDVVALHGSAGNSGAIVHELPAHGVKDFTDHVIPSEEGTFWSGHVNQVMYGLDGEEIGAWTRLELDTFDGETEVVLRPVHCKADGVLTGQVVGPDSALEGVEVTAATRVCGAGGSAVTNAYGEFEIPLDEYGNGTPLDIQVQTPHGLSSIIHTELPFEEEYQAPLHIECDGTECTAIVVDVE